MKILYAIFFHIFYPADSNYVTLQVKIENQSINSVSLLVPINKDLFLNYNTGNNEILKTGNNFSFKVPFNHSSFFLLKVNGEIVVPLALKAQDSISIIMKRQVNSGQVNYKIEFAGSNALAHTIYKERFFPAGKNFGFFDDITKKVKTLSDYYLRAKLYIDSLTSVWDSLKVNKLIDNDVYDLYVAETKGSLYREAFMKFTKVNEKDTTYPTYIKRQRIKLVMFHHSQAFNPILLKTYTGEYLYQLYLNNIANGDEAFSDKQLKESEFKYYYYYDTAYREIAWGGLLHYFKAQYPTAKKEADIKIFEKYYPNSQFLKKINQLQDSILNTRKALKIPVTIDTSSYESVRQVLSKVNGRFIFIDLWATWCLPCIAEFNFTNTLSPFLESKGIKQVLLSLDKREDIHKWKDFIQKNLIPGYHFLTTDKVEDELLKILAKHTGETNLFIPRYLLYDKQTEEFHIDLPKPSTGVVLQLVIENILSKSGN